MTGQPREHTVSCGVCGKATWNRDAVCDLDSGRSLIRVVRVERRAVAR